MPILDTPITTDDRNLKKVLGQKQPAIVVLYDSSQNDKPLQDALNREAKKYAGDLLVVRVDAKDNPDTMSKYNYPQVPALVTLTKSFFGRNIKSKAEQVRPSDVRAHIAHLLEDKPLPQPKTKSNGGSTPKKKKKALHVTDSTWNKEVLKSKTPVLVDFWAEWCGPCRAVAPFIDQMAAEYAGKVKVVKLNVDQNRRTAGQFGIRGIPAFILFKDGKPVNRTTGASPNSIKGLLNSALYG